MIWAHRWNARLHKRKVVEKWSGNTGGLLKLEMSQHVVVIADYFPLF